MVGNALKSIYKQFENLDTKDGIFFFLILFLVLDLQKMLHFDVVVVQTFSQ